MLKLYRTFAVLMLIVLPLFSQNKPHIAVLDISNQFLKPQEAVALTERLIQILEQTDKYVLLDRSMISTILEEQGFQQTGCTSSECAVEVGQLLGVEKMVACNIGQVGRYYTISLKIIDVATGKIDKSVGYDVLGGIETVLLTGLQGAVDKLVGNEVPVTKKAKKSEKEKPKPLSSEQIYQKELKQKKALTATFATLSGISTVTATIFWIKKNNTHTKYLSATNQDDMDALITAEKNQTTMAIISTVAAATFIPLTIHWGRKEIQRNSVTVSFVPIISKRFASLQIIGEF